MTPTRGDTSDDRYEEREVDAYEAIIAAFGAFFGGSAPAAPALSSESAHGGPFARSGGKRFV
jgi:hypothetical protein